MNARSLFHRLRKAGIRLMAAFLVISGLFGPLPAPVLTRAVAGEAPAGLSATEWQGIARQIEAAEPQALADWAAAKKLVAADGLGGDSFGVSVAVDGPLLVVGAHQAGIGVDDGRGAAYLFHRHKGGPDAWGLVKKLQAGDGAGGDYFGSSVGVSGDKVVVGAPWADDPGKQNMGAAYVFYRNEDGADHWGQVAKLTSSPSGGGDRFGSAVAISGDTVLVGAGQAAYGTNEAQGAAYIFERNYDPVNPGTPLADNWGQVQELAASGLGPNCYFGSAVALSGGVAVVGAWGADVGGTLGAGAAYVFYRNQGGADKWGQQEVLAAPVAAAQDRFGWSVAINETADRVAVGAYQRDVAGAVDQGLAYVFERNQGAVPDSWGYVASLEAEDGAAGEQFGYAVAFSGSQVLVGAPQATVADLAGRGAAYLFARNEGGAGAWGQAGKLVAGDGAAEDGFGAAVGLSGEVLVAGAWGTMVDGEEDRGAAYVYHDARDWWLPQPRLTVDDGAVGAIADLFGCSVSVDGDTLVVGAPWATVGGVEQGAAHVFARDWGGVGNWGLVQTLKADDGMLWDGFGHSVAIDGDTVVVGAPWADIQGEQNMGAAYVFYRNEDGVDLWGQVAKLTSWPSGGGNDRFGSAVAISGDRVLVGAEGASGTNQWQGAAYILERNKNGADAWGRVQELAATGLEAYSYFGSAVALSGGVAVVGAYGADVGGAAYVFARNSDGMGGSAADNWGEVKKLVASDGQQGDSFGLSVAISGDTVVAGDPYADVSANAYQGTAYVFARNGGDIADGWRQVQKLVAEDGSEWEFFGHSVAVCGDTVVAGARETDPLGAREAAVDGKDFKGAAYVFARDRDGADQWHQVEKLTADDGSAGDWFGQSVAASGHTIAVGASKADVGGNEDRGVAYLFEAIARAPTTTTITAHSPHPSQAGETVTVAFAVSAGSGTPTGQGIVGDGSENCTGTLQGGSGSCQLTFATPGSRTLTAAYGGDDQFLPSTSPGVAHTVVGEAKTFLPFIVRY